MLRTISEVAEAEQPIRRRDRHVLTTVVFWHLRHPGPSAHASFGHLLDAADDRGWTRPAVVATASAWRARARSSSTANALRGSRTAASAQSRPMRQAVPDTGTRPELSKLVRALAEWPCAEAHRLLWRLATNRTVEVDWPAAKALATAKGGPWEALRSIVEDCLRSAAASSPPRMSRPEDALGNEIASLACVLPALRGASDAAETQLAAVAQLCLDADMSPLRGEMALAQGLKLAILKGMTSDLNVADVRALLFGADRPPSALLARPALAGAGAPCPRVAPPGPSRRTRRALRGA